MQIPPQPVLFTNWLCYWLKEESSLSNCQNQFFMKQMFVLIKINIGEKVEFFSSEHSRKWEIYLVFWVAEHMRHMTYSVIEINICSQNLQEIIIYKTIKKNLLQSTKDILSETIIIVHVFMRKPVLQICTDSYRVLNFKLVKKNRYEIYPDINFISSMNM